MSFISAGGERSLVLCGGGKASRRRPGSSSSRGHMPQRQALDARAPRARRVRARLSLCCPLHSRSADTLQNARPTCPTLPFYNRRTRLQTDTCTHKLYSWRRDPTPRRPLCFSSTPITLEHQKQQQQQDKMSDKVAAAEAEQQRPGGKQSRFDECVICSKNTSGSSICLRANSCS